MTPLPTFTTLGAGPTVLMLHGVDGGSLAWAPQVESFASRGWRAVAWNMPGYGHSAPIEPYNFKGLAQSCLALIDALACESVVLLGHDAGGMVAQEVALRWPQRVNRLVLCATVAAFAGADAPTNGADRDPEHDGQCRFIAERSAPLDAGQSMEVLAQQLVPRRAGAAALREGVDLAAHCLAQVSPATYRRALEALAAFDRRADLARIRVPTLLVAGESDRDFPPAQMRAIADRITDSRQVELRGIGHWPHLEAPDEFDGLVLGFLADSQQIAP
ncbi:MAG: Hydrolase, alpha/beta fold family [Burkholderiaceae bacterium]|jgi:pimeloyl-ACP methyl ester carboxylesterase|nr:MAG: Hydrolase, alpha/beta fold family [Burkholderiaceae bacterium]